LSSFPIQLSAVNIATRSDILYKHAVNEVAINIKSQMLTPEHKSKLLSDILKAQGRGVSWGEKPSFDWNEIQSLDAHLLACGCCGVRTFHVDKFKRTYEEVDVKYLIDKLKLKDDDEDEDIEDDDESDGTNLAGPRSRRTQGFHRRLMEREPLCIPCNDDGDTNEVELWRLCSVWPAKKPEELNEEKDKLPDYMFDEGNPVYCHLHPEFVREDVCPGEENRYWATICSHCKESLDENVSGVDFGDARRLGLEPLTERERQIISKNRHYILILKIESNTDDGRVIERGQSKVKGCGIYFNDDSAKVVSNLLSQDSINGDVSLQFVGPKGEYDSLAKKVLGSANVKGRAWVIYQWLKVLQQVNLHYLHDDELPDFEEVKARLKTANETLVEEATCINDENLVRETEIAKDDARHIRTGGEDEDVDGTGVVEEDVHDFPLRCSFIMSNRKNKRGSAADRDYIESAAEALGNSDTKLHLSRREKEPLNDYENGDSTIAMSSPDLFIFGDAYNSDRPTLDKYQTEHLLMQYTANAGSNRPLLCQLFEQNWRHGVIGNMHAKVSSNPADFEKFANEFQSEEFQAKLKAAAKDSEGSDAKYVLNKITPFLTFGGRKSAFGALERNESAGEILALGRHHGCAPGFLTFGIDDINTPTAIRVALPSRSNHEFPAVVSSASRVEMETGIKLNECTIPIPHGYRERMKLMCNNPVGTAFAYKQMVHDIMTILVGIKPSKDSGDNNRRTKTEFITPDKVGIVGTSWAFFGKTETTHSGSLHFHVIIWGGLSAELIESVSDIPELGYVIASVLDSQFSAQLDRHEHVQDLIYSNIKKINSQKKKLRDISVRQDTSGASKDISTEMSPSKGKLSIMCLKLLLNYCLHLSCTVSELGLDTARATLSTPSEEKDDGIGPPSIKRVTASSSLDTSIPGAFAAFGKTLDTCQDTNCQHVDCTSDDGTGAPTKHSEISTPQSILLPPDPTDIKHFNSHVAKTVRKWGLHTKHTFTCHKPPKGYHGCRMCYPRAPSNGTRPIEIRSEIRPDGEEIWNEVDPKVKSWTEGTKTIKQEYVDPYDPEVHHSKENLYPLPSSNSRTTVLELNRPVLKPLPELAEGTTKEDIITRLYNAMFPDNPNKKLQFGEGSESILVDQVDMLHIADEQDKNHLFYGLLLGLIESSQLKAGSKSVEELRSELMQCLMKLPFKCKLGDETVEQHIKSRMVQEESNTSSIEDKLELYSQLMTNATGDDCYEGGALEVKLFAQLMNVTVALYDKEDDMLTRAEYIAAKGGDRPIIHLFRIPTNVQRRSGSLNPPEYKYMFFTPKWKSIMDKLQAFKTKELEKLYDMSSEALPMRNGTVVDFSPVLASLLGCNSNLLHLGSVEQSKAALFYIGPYINKDGVKITDALPIFMKAHEHALNFPSVADDSGTSKRHVQHVLTRVINKMNSLIEVSDTQIACSLLGMSAGLCSDEFVPCDIKAYLDFVIAELQRVQHTRPEDEDSESDADLEDMKEDYDEEDILQNDLLRMEEEDDAGLEDDQQGDLCDTEDETSDVQLDSDPMECDSDKDDDMMDTEDNDHDVDDEEDDDNNDEDFSHFNSSVGQGRIYEMNDGKKMPVSYAALYRYRGEELKNCSRYTYSACVNVVDIESNISPSGRKKSKAFPFGAGLGIEKNYQQVLRLKQKIPKLTRSPPPPPQIKPQPPDLDESDVRYEGQYKTYKSDLAAWRKKADRFARFYLTLFRPETELYEKGQINTYKYDYEAWEEFYNQLCWSRHEIDELRLNRIDRVMNSWRVDKTRREMLADFRGRARTIWSDEQKEANKAFFGGSRQARYDDDEMDYISSVAHDLSSQQSTNAKKQLGHSRAIMNTFKDLTETSEDSTGRGESSSSSTAKSSAKVPTLPFNSGLDESKRRPRDKCDEDYDDNRVQRPSEYQQIPNLDKNVRDYIKSCKLSQDKNIAVELAYEHFKAIRTGEAERPDYEAPLLFVSGGPGCGKSTLIEALDGVVEIMKVGSQMKCAYMGSAAVNIGGSTFIRSWSVPIFSKGAKKRIGTWNPDKLRALKRRFDNDIYSMCDVVIDEVSTLEPYMLATLNARCQEKYGNDKLFGGRMVIIVGDFDQKPPTAGGKEGTLPGSVMKYIEEMGNKPTIWDSSEQLSPTRMGGFLFSKFRYIKLTRQHRSGDPKHMAVLEKMCRTGIGPTVKDLKSTYKKLSAEDMESDDFRFATMIVTGNNERREINALQSKRWAQYHGLNTIRWARDREEGKWIARPESVDDYEHALQNACFWEYFPPNAMGYLNSYGINADEGLANGTQIKYHSLSFKDRKEERRFKELCDQAKPGDVITLDSPPTAINVELFPDYPEDTAATKAKNVASRRTWLASNKGSCTTDGRVVIPVSITDGKQIKYVNTYIPGCTDLASDHYYHNSLVGIKDYFPIEPAFSITVDKAQVCFVCCGLIYPILYSFLTCFIDCICLGKDYQSNSLICLGTQVSSQQNQVGRLICSFKSSSKRR